MAIPVCCIGCDDKEERVVRGLIAALASRLDTAFVYAAPEQARLRIVDTRQPLGREIIELSTPAQLHHIMALVADRQALNASDDAGPVLRLKVPLSGSAFIETLNRYVARVARDDSAEPAAESPRFYRGTAVTIDPDTPEDDTMADKTRARRVYRGQVVED